MKSTVLMLRLIIVLAAGTVTAGCIDFDQQLLSYRYDQQADTLRIFQLYEGIHAEKKAAPVKSEIDELRSVVCGERSFLFTNWIYEFHRSGMEAQRRKVLKEAEEAGPGPERTAMTIYARLIELLLAAVQVDNGQFFINPAGELSGFQFVSVTGVSRLLPQVNRELVRLAATDELEKFSDADRKRIRAVRQWISIDGNEIRLRRPLPYADVVDKPARGFPVMGDLGGNVLSNYDEPFAELILGRRHSDTTSLIKPRTQYRRPDDELIAYVKKTYGLATGVDVSGLRNEFLRSGTLPEIYRAPPPACQEQTMAPETATPKQ